MQFTADMTLTALIVSDLPETSALGAAMAAMFGLGIVRTLDEFEFMRLPLRIYRADVDLESRARLLNGWRRAVERVMWERAEVRDANEY
jgi:glycerol kinase